MSSAICLKGHENPEDHDYCGTCGQLLPRDGIEIEGHEMDGTGPVMGPSFGRNVSRRAVALVGILAALAGATAAGIVGAAAIAAPARQAVSASPASPASPGFVPVPALGADPAFLRGIHLIPAGEAATIADGWRVSVAGVNRDATAEMQEINYLNMPRLGLRYVLVRVHLERLGDDLRSPSSDLSFSLMTASGLQPFSDAANPDDLSSIGQLFPRGQADADLVFEVKPSETGLLVLAVADAASPETFQFLAV